ncbi:hypothetical protein RO3G_03748 [Rhizopus delemar RA 99-880]|uniref:Uncharacterized protein n=1 Tax=Rhizopus delemar (strain RA 99-880 / ATCC MYA-4621 / FGSC 9543 / NRRL 43880) TaxID=246409 RepID=I1BS63_RHIO9|nr:hypothetical protein RO3G_03748 [Rhizopus delemar RA 99-880]|eukprot:EIE79043.1 hypothetical protein RO3G_03748 [Rhizopus delemar RA 99-880]
MFLTNSSLPSDNHNSFFHAGIFLCEIKCTIFFFGIVERTVQNYVKTYKEDDEKRLPGGRKQRVSWEGRLQPHHTNFLCVFYEKNPRAILWQARDALLEAFSEIQSITLSGLHRHLVLHVSLTLKKLEAIVSSRTTLGNLQIRRHRALEWKRDENMTDIKAMFSLMRQVLTCIFVEVLVDPRGECLLKQ